jgi:hypothetical protein
VPDPHQDDDLKAALWTNAKEKRAAGSARTDGSAPFGRGEFTLGKKRILGSYMRPEEIQIKKAVRYERHGLERGMQVCGPLSVALKVRQGRSLRQDQAVVRDRL